MSLIDPFKTALAQIGVLALAKLKAELGVVSDLLLKPGSSFSLLSLAVALAISVIWVVMRRRARGRGVSLKLILRALFPRRILLSPSTKADMGFTLLNIFAVSGLIGWGLLTNAAVAHWILDALTNSLGHRPRSGINPWLIQAFLTLAMFLAYEFAYWLDHYLCHTVPFLWEFHRVHHTAETLTPLTVFRVHPIDTLVFYNIVAVVTGATAGLVGYIAGGLIDGFTLEGANVLLLAFIFLTVHLQHSHVWIAFTGVWGRIFASPAHHQIHHSANPAHFGQNLGSCLVLFDWLFGTLRIPTRAREPLVYGVEPGQEAPHSITGGLITPFERALATLKPKRLAAPTGYEVGPDPGAAKPLA